MLGVAVPVSQPEILLVTLNARYHHCSFGLRYLFANLRELQSRARIDEFTISQSSREIAEKILASRPRIVGFGVYIWNTSQTEEVVSIIKRVSPETLVVLGGPEVSFETETQRLFSIADYTICGEAEVLFYEFCSGYLAGKPLPTEKKISGELPDLKLIASPYSFYSDEDIRHRVIYVEASRGCPYKCEYCLSSLDKSVRGFDLDLFLAEMQGLIDRGVRQFKFVDRTFNLSVATSTRILRFFLERMEFGLFVHFELVPDRLPIEIRNLITQFPRGSLQFEIGIQTWSPEVSRLVSRRQDYSRIVENFKFLREHTGVHTHADLIVGLPGETLPSFAKGFDAVSALEPDEVQVGLLKRLKGTPISRHDEPFQMVYQEHPPFQILKTSTMDFATIQRMTRFSKFWDLIANSGNFVSSIRILRDLACRRPDSSLFECFMELSEMLSMRHAQTHGIALQSLVESVWVFLTQNLALDEGLVREALIEDYTGRVKRDLPAFLRSKGAGSREQHRQAALPAGQMGGAPQRQRKHQAGARSEVVQ